MGKCSIAQGPRLRSWIVFAESLAIAVALGVWVFFWPHTSEGDSPLHFLNAAEGLVNPGAVVTAWARPGFKVLFMWSTPWGILASRWVMCVLGAVLAWQTIRLAEDLGLRRAWAAALLMLAQPITFWIVSDTMSEGPMALGIVVAIRLWLAKRILGSALAVAYLPLVRPEGFFFLVLWAGMLVHRRGFGALPTIPLLGWGLVAWALSNAVFHGDPFFFIKVWSWPMGSYPSYGKGGAFDYLVRLPVYFGPVLFPLFLVGLRCSWRRSMILPWSASLIVLGVHSLLWWRGAYASAGLLRILVCTAPFTALVCLFGLNWLMERVAEPVGRFAQVGVILFAFVWAMIAYVATPSRQESRAVVDVVNLVRGEREVIDSAPLLFAGTDTCLAELNPPFSRRTSLGFGPDLVRRNLQDMPVGSVGFWDNRQSETWRGLKIEDLFALGFELLAESEFTFTPFPRVASVRWAVKIRYVAVRKVR